MKTLAGILAPAILAVPTVAGAAPAAPLPRREILPMPKRSCGRSKVVIRPSWL